MKEEEKGTRAHHLGLESRPPSDLPGEVLGASLEDGRFRGRFVLMILMEAKGVLKEREGREVRL